MGEGEGFGVNVFGVWDLFNKINVVPKMRIIIKNEIITILCTNVYFDKITRARRREIAANPKAIATLTLISNKSVLLFFIIFLFFQGRMLPPSKIYQIKYR